MMKTLAALLVLAGLSGCASWPEHSDEVVYSAGGLQKWALDGRVGVRSRTDAWQADMVWAHDERQDRLRLSGPLSQGLVSIVLQRDLIYINEGDGHEHLAKDPDAALKARLGFSVPLKSLSYWVLGMPNPAEPSKPFSSEGAVGFEQQGWQITPSGRVDLEGRIVPDRLVVEGAGVRLKIIVDRWDPS
jgi:outer membrane lipoprotein LolB